MNRRLPSVNAPRILIVDDNAPLRYALARTLRQHGFDVIEAATGDEALASPRPNARISCCSTSIFRTFTASTSRAASRAAHARRTFQSCRSPRHSYKWNIAWPGWRPAPMPISWNRWSLANWSPTSVRCCACATPKPACSGRGRCWPLSSRRHRWRSGVRSRRVRATWNPAAERLFASRGTSSARSVRRGPMRRPPAFLTDAALLGALGRGEAVTALEREGCATTAPRWNCRSSPLRSINRRRTGYVAIIEDISLRKQFERERRDLLAPRARCPP